MSFYIFPAFFDLLFDLKCFKDVFFFTLKKKSNLKDKVLISFKLGLKRLLE